MKLNGIKRFSDIRLMKEKTWGWSGINKKKCIDH